MKPLIYFSALLISIFLLNPLYSQDFGEVIWRTAQGNSAADLAYSMDQDLAGNIYLVGHATADWPIANQPGVTIINPHNPPNVHGNREHDVFIAKFNNGGTLLWLTFFGDAFENDYGYDIVLDHNGNIFITGTTRSWYQDGVLWKTDIRAFVAKFNNSGNQEWYLTLGNRGPAHEGKSIDVDQFGNVYVAGHSNGNWNWSDGTGPLNPWTSAYGGNLFITKFTNSGNYIWHTFMGPGLATPSEIKIRNNKIYLAGTASGRLNIPGISPAIDHAQNYSDFAYYDGFAATISLNGIFEWYSFLGVNFDQPVSSGQIAWVEGFDVDNTGMMYVTGNSWRNFNNSIPRYPWNVNHGSQSFVVKFNTKVNDQSALVWSTFMGKAYHDSGYDIQLDNYGNIVIASEGLYEGMQLTVLNNQGYRIWNRSYNNYPFHSGNLKSILIDPQQNILVSGFYRNPWPASWGGAVINEMVYPYNDEILLAKINSGIPAISAPAIYPENKLVMQNNGNSIYNYGIVFHPDVENVTLNSDIGTISLNTDGTWSWQHSENGWTEGIHMITLTATHSNGLSSTESFFVEITPDLKSEIIGDGLWWLSTQQRYGGYWNGPYRIINIDAPVTCTGFALTKFTEFAFENGVSPFDSDNYVYADVVNKGFTYFFEKAKLTSNGIYIFDDTHPFNEFHSTAIALMAISSSRSPDRIADFSENENGVPTMSYFDLAQQLVNFLSNNVDPNSCWGDNYVNGYVAYALLYAEAFGIEIEPLVKDLLSNWIDYIQNDVSGGAGRWTPDDEMDVNMINTAFAMVQMHFVGDELESPRVQNAYNFILEKWNDPSSDPMWSDKYIELYYAIMKAFQVYNIDILDIEGVQIDWYEELSYNILNSQSDEGYWIFAWGGDRLINTCFALLTLEKSGPHYLNSPPEISVDNTSVSTEEGNIASNSGGYLDPDGDPVLITSSIGIIETDGAGNWDWNYDSNDGPSETQFVTLEIVDDMGAENSITFDLVVQNIDPEITSISVPFDPVSIDNQPINISAMFEDPGMAYDAPYIATVNFGDNEIFEPCDIIDYTIQSQSHYYNDAGVYNITLRIQDKDGGTSQIISTEFIVIYDPSEGFVTGGGWINSLPGAYLPDPELSGKANFGFVSKYKKGKSVPEGNTEFQFKTANLNFNSSTYEWMIINNHKATFKGDGTINGIGNYGFMLTSIDAGLTPSTDNDLFRIQIWDKDMDDLMLYDNKIGETEPFADPYTELGGGSIIIHKKNDNTPLKHNGTLNNILDLQISPNPAREFININYNLPQSSDVIFLVYKSDGKVVKEIKKPSLNKGRHHIEIETMNLTEGLYFIQLKMDESTVNIKFVKTK